MIVFDLACQPLDHRFEGWFASSKEFARQQQSGLVLCPQCGSSQIAKAPMAPAVGRKGNQLAASVAPVSVMGGLQRSEVQKVMTQIARAQADALKDSRWVGAGFAEQSRAMHYGEKDTETIHGQATPHEAQAMLDEGIAIMPLLFPVAPPDDLN